MTLYDNVQEQEKLEKSGKRGFVYRFIMSTPLRHSEMACVLKGSHSFTCILHIHPLMKGVSICNLSPSQMKKELDMNIILT